MASGPARRASHRSRHLDANRRSRCLGDFHCRECSTLGPECPEEARGYSLLAAEYGYNHADIVRVVGKSRSHVANTLRLLALPEHSRDLLSSGAISAGHCASVCFRFRNLMSSRIASWRGGLTVRDVEKLGEGDKSTPSEVKAVRVPDAVTKDLENRLTLSLGTKVMIHGSKRLKELRIKFKDVEQLEHICEKLMGQ